MRPLALIAVAAAVLAGGALAAPRSAGIKDPDTKAWFQLTEQLASDAMEGRDIGSPGYDRAARLVRTHFRVMGLTPAGDDGTWFQTLPVHESRVEASRTSFLFINGSVGAPIPFLREITVRPTDRLPAALDGQLSFRGYCAPADLTDVRGRVVICFNTKRAGLPTSAQRIKAVHDAGALALVQIDDPYFTIEPPRWPAAYARTVTIAGAPAPTAPEMPVMTASTTAFGLLLSGSDRDAAAILKLGGAKQPLPSFDPPGRLQARFQLTKHDYDAQNVVALMPGSDPALRDQVLVVSAHLDGYGFGEPVDGDNLYNGALDDAAYVATLVRFAEAHRGRPLKRSVLFLVTTGEEKGLLGAHWFVDHPTVSKSSIVADINLDQLRPLFPLKILTQLGVDDSTLGADAKAVAATMGVRIQADPEPERSLMTRADHYPFVQAGIPATGFIFGYEPGTEAERRYRQWYQVRYHRPQDDLTQPMDFQAAGDFNRFFYKLAERVADAPLKPAITKGR